MTESKQTKAVDLREARTLMDEVRAYAAEEFGFAPWKVEPLAVSKDGPAEWCGFAVCGVRYASAGGALHVDGREEGPCIVARDGGEL